MTPEQWSPRRTDPLHETVDPDVVVLASDQARYMTNHTVAVDDVLLFQPPSPHVNRARGLCVDPDGSGGTQLYLPAGPVPEGRQQMKFGLNVINFGPSASAAAIGSTVEWAEAVGFAIAMLSDHVSVTPDAAPMYPERFYEPFTTLAWLAARTTRIQLGTTVVIVPYR